MTNNTDNPTHRSKLSSCAIWMAIPCVLFLALALIVVLNNRPPNIHVPSPKMPEDNGFAYFTKATDLVRMDQKLKELPHQSWTEADYGKLARDNAAVIAQVRLGLTKPCMCPPVRSIHSLGNAYGPSIRFREAARVMVYTARYHELTGRPDQSVRIRLDCMEFGAAVQRGAGVIASTSDSSIEHMGRHGIEPLLPKLSPSQLAGVARSLERIQAKRVPFADIVSEEGRAWAALSSELLKDPLRKNWVPDNLDSTGSKVTDLVRDAKYAIESKAGMIRENASYYAALAHEQRRPYMGTSSVPVPKNALAQLWIMDLAGERLVFVQTEAMTVLLQTEVALLRYHADHFTYPAHLSDLAPKYLKTVPIDPFGQTKPLIYRPKDNGKSFLLYSRGPNMKDNGGVPGKWAGSKTRGDIVAGKLCQARKPAPL